MLATLGVITILCLLAAVMSKRLSPLVALIALPIIAALLGGFGLQTSAFIITGIKNVAPVVGMFVFAILFFGIMTDAGMLDPIIDRILRTVGTRPTRIVVGTATLALLVHLDGSGAVTFLVTIPAMLPLYTRLGMDKRILACVAAMAAGVKSSMFSKVISTGRLPSPVSSLGTWNATRGCMALRRESKLSTSTSRNLRSATGARGSAGLPARSAITPMTKGNWTFFSAP